MNPTERLIRACQFGDVAAAKRAIGEGADVNAGEDYKAIHWAAQEGYIKSSLSYWTTASISTHTTERDSPLYGGQSAKTIRNWFTI